MTQDARYRVYHNGKVTLVSVDQSANAGVEVSLGTFDFSADGSELVYLDDVTEDSTTGTGPCGTVLSGDTQRHIAFDSITVRVPPPPPDPAPKDDFELGVQPWLPIDGDPVSASTGNYTLEHEDVSIPSLGDSELAVTRFYNSKSDAVGFFGRGWSSSVDVHLQEYLSGGVSVRFPDGQGRFWDFDGTNYVANDGVNDTLVSTATGWELTLTDQSKYIFEAFGSSLSEGRVSLMEDRHGNGISYAYDASGLLLSMTDDAGRSLVFTHNGEFIETMSDPIGRTWTYTYDGELLRTVTNPRGGTTEYQYGEEGCLTEVRDPQMITYLRNVYDSDCRVIEQYDAAGSMSTFQYLPGETIFTDNLGRKTTSRYDSAFRKTERIDALGKSEFFTWDADYNLRTYTDRRGNVWSYDYDSRGNMTKSTCPTTCVTSYEYNATNDLIKVVNALLDPTNFNWVGDLLQDVTLPDGAFIDLDYDALGQIASIKDGNGNPTTFSHDVDGNLVEVRDALLNPTTMIYDDVGRRRSITDGNGHTTRFDYDKSDNLIELIDPRGNDATFEYDLNDRLLRAYDRRGGVRQFEYDVNLRLRVEIDAEGHRTEHGYDLMYNRTSTTNARGITTEFRYDDLDRLKEVEDELAQVTKLGYDFNGNLIKVTDPLLNVTSFTYDARNLRETMTDPLLGFTRYYYDALGQLHVIRDPRLAQTVFYYDEVGRLTLRRDDGLNTYFAYDLAGNLVSRIDPKGNETVFDYDRANRLISVIDPELHQTRLGYDRTRNLASVTNHRSATTRFEYDPNDNLELVVDALTGEVKFGYDEEDNQISVTDPRGNETRFEYYLDGLLRRVIEPGNLVSELVYDPAHNLTDFTNAKSNTTSRVYDALDRPTLETDPLGNETRFEWDALRRLTKVTDAANNPTAYAYDALGRLTRVTDALGQKTNYEYDIVGNLTKITDAMNRVTSFRYDAHNRLERETNPLGKSWFYRYDQSGNLTDKVTPRGGIVYEYDKDDLLVATRRGLYASDVSFEYDGAHNLVTMTDVLGVTENEYDLLDRLKSSTNHARQTVAYGYDAASNLTRFTHEDGSVIEYGYDQNNRQNRVEDPDGNVFEAFYDQTHNLTRIAYPNATEALATYDAADRMLSVVNRKTSGALIDQFVYTLDRVGNRVRTDASHRWPSSVDVTTTYTYDKIYRLTRSADSVGRFTDYNFDAVGNRLKLTSNYDPYRTPADVAPYTVTSTYNAADQLTRGVHSHFGTTNYTYDANGNRLRREGPDVWTGSGETLRTDYLFDGEDRPIKISNSKKVGTAWQLKDEERMDYDGLDRLFRRTHDDKQLGGIKKWSEFVYDGLDPVSESQNQVATSAYTNYHRGLGRMLAQSDFPSAAPPSASLYHHDGLGSITAMTQSLGQPVHSYRYSDYGTPLEVTGKAAPSTSFSAPHNRFSYTGQEWVPETRNHHFYAREYEPYVGVWTRMDEFRGAIEEPSSLNRFNYVSGNPAASVDRYGYSELQNSSEARLAFSILPDSSSKWNHDAPIVSFFDVGGVPQTSASFEELQPKGISKHDPVHVVESHVNAGSRCPEPVVSATGNPKSQPRLPIRSSYEAEEEIYLANDPPRWFWVGPVIDYETAAGTVILSDENRAFRFALDHPYLTGAAIGLSGGAVAARPTKEVAAFYPEATLAGWDFLENYWNMRQAETPGADKYFHCMANCESASRGPGGVIASYAISEGRELSDSIFKGDPQSAVDADRRANSIGRSAGLSGNGDCRNACMMLRPADLDPKY